MRRGAAAGAALVLVLVGGVVPLVSPIGAGVSRAASGAAIPFDFDGDGYADLAIGIPGESLRGKVSAGAVQVLYGSASGATTRDQLWHQGRRGVKGTIETRDLFGNDLGSGDFDSDGYADLAIGIPWEDIGSVRRAGAVQVLYGSAQGLTSRDQIWHQGKKGVPGSNETADRFGETLAVGDYDGDGYADLAVGVLGEDLGATKNAGRVVVLRGSAEGLTAAGSQLWGEDSPGIASEPSETESFGRHLAAGDVNGDGRDDLTISVRDQGRDGAVHLLLGNPSGLTASGSQYFRTADVGFDGSAWVWSLWLADVNADGRDDLTLAAFGGVAVLHGHADGLHPAPLSAPGQPGADAFWSGWVYWQSITGDLTGDGYADLAALSPQEGVDVVIGTAEGLGSEIAHWPVRSGGEQRMNVLPLSGGTHMWLVIASRGTTVNSQRSAGAVTALKGTVSGAAGTAATWHQDTPGIKGSAEKADHFGHSIGGTSPGGA